MEHVLSTPEFAALEKEAEAREQALQRGVPPKVRKLGSKWVLTLIPEVGFKMRHLLSLKYHCLEMAPSWTVHIAPPLHVRPEFRGNVVTLSPVAQGHFTLGLSLTFSPKALQGLKCPSLSLHDTHQCTIRFSLRESAPVK